MKAELKATGVRAGMVTLWAREAKEVLIHVEGGILDWANTVHVYGVEVVSKDQVEPSSWSDSGRMSVDIASFPE